jgi:hypothetical protein
MDFTRDELINLKQNNPVFYARFVNQMLEKYTLIIKKNPSKFVVNRYQTDKDSYVYNTRCKLKLVDMPPIWQKIINYIIITSKIESRLF